MTQAATAVTDAKNHVQAFRLSGVRTAEKLLLGFLCYLTIAAFLFPLDLRQRLTLAALNLLAAMLIIFLSQYGIPERRRFLSIVRDWLPSILILVAYRESGLFFTPDPTHRLDYVFVHWDDMILKNPWAGQFLTWGAPWLQRYLELAYFLCYPIVPLGLGTLCLARRSASQRPQAAAVYNRHDDLALGAHRYWLAIDHFWSAVLLAAFTSYLLFPLFPLTPPRELFNDVPGPQVAPLLRGMNHWLLGKYSVGACLFPSAHVASTTAMAFVIRRHLPSFGWVFVVVALSIALATVYGRYHYAADALTGALMGIAAYFVSTRILR